MRRLAPLGFAAALIVLAGCGSSSSGDSNSGTDAATSGGGSLSKAEFVAKADALCEASKVKQEPLREKLGEVAQEARSEERNEGITDGTRRELAQTLGTIVAVAEASQSKVQALAIPKTEADQLEAIFRKTEAAFEASLAYGNALEHREDAKAQAIAEKANAQTGETAALAKQYGFEVCGTQP